ncbi:MAG: hypothetical protein EHM58_10905 [Ignavibacteriae bacterium]|nr:MAG: hypothetical protein EHM58_10905 [Ignavibacteriota bacterium]
MPLSFRNLNGTTRQLMLDELNYDIKNDNLYVSNRLNSKGVVQYPKLLEKSFTEGTEFSLATELDENACFGATYQRKTKNGFSTVKMPYDAPFTLAEGEFNRFYIRALCFRALNENCYLRIYRAKEVLTPRPESTAIIGEIIMDVKELLNDMRNNIGTTTLLGVPAGPNSGLSVELYKKD